MSIPCPDCGRLFISVHALRAHRRWCGQNAARADPTAGRDAHAAFLSQIKRLAVAAGWNKELIYSTYDSRHSQAGLPDLILCRPEWGRLLIRELKTGGARPTRAQRRWLAALQACGLDAGVWRPEDQDRIVQELSTSEAQAAGDSLGRARALEAAVRTAGMSARCECRECVDARVAVLARALQGEGMAS